MQVILDSLLFSLRACVLLDQRPGNATALDQEFLVPVQLIVCVRWRFLDKMNKFSTANQIWPSFRWAFSLAQGSRSLVQTRRIAASGDEMGAWVQSLYIQGLD